MSAERISFADAVFGGDLAASDRFGASVAPLGSLDGDPSVLHLAAGATGDDDGGVDVGAVWILSLDESGEVTSTQKISAIAGGFAGALDPSDSFGQSLATPGDLDGDGVADLAVGAPGDDDGGADEGAVWILFLNGDGTVKSEQKISATEGGFGGTLGTAFGSAAASLGDLDGDGRADLAVVARPSIWILALNAAGVVESETEIAIPGSPVSFPPALAALGDVDGDGITDLAVGMPGQFFVLPELRILLLNADGTVKAERVISDDGNGEMFCCFFAGSVTSLGDLDGDGITDLAVGQQWNEDGAIDMKDLGCEMPNPVGAVWILFLNADGTLKSSQKISREAGGLGDVLTCYGRFGHSVTSLGDLDGDGTTDLAAGAPGILDGAASSGVSAVLVLFLRGSDRQCFTLDGETEDDFVTPLVNGQDLSTPPEFGNRVALSTSGPNAGAAVFDSTPGGPNDPSQDRDLLVGSGNIVMLQTDDNTAQTFPGIFDRPNDDEDGGTLRFDFLQPVIPASVDLVDIDAGADEASSVVLTDSKGRARVYSVPPGWTGDILQGGIGKLTLDLVSLVPQPGFASTALAVQDAGFDPSAVVLIEVRLGSSGGIDDLGWCTRRAQRGPQGQRTRRSSGGATPASLQLDAR